MDDLISRQDAIDALNEVDDGASISTAITVIEGLPSAQPEIIRCKDCIYFDKYSDCIEMYQLDGFCAFWERNTCENWYCSGAERREE